MISDLNLSSSFMKSFNINVLLDAVYFILPEEEQDEPKSKKRSIKSKVQTIIVSEDDQTLICSFIEALLAKEKTEIILNAHTSGKIKTLKESGDEQLANSFIGALPSARAFDKLYVEK